MIAEGVLHHLSPLEKVFSKIKCSLKIGGFLILNDYVGPDRFQWDQNQIQFCNGLLRFIPESLRTYRGTSIPKKKIWRPGTMSMRIHNLSKAIESSKTLQAVRDNFEILLQKDCGGAILHPLLKDIAHHFMDCTPEAETVLEFLFTAEDYLMSAGVIESDFTFMVARKV